MKHEKYLSTWIKRFLQEYVISTRNLAKNTQRSYRDTFKLLLPFISNQSKKKIENLLVDDITADAVKAFLLDIEENRQNSIATRNQRLAAISALAKFIGTSDPEYLEQYRHIRTIPLKKSSPRLITYLEKSEMDALLNAPDIQTRQGKRDNTLLLFMYNTGARASEIAELIISDLELVRSKQDDISTVLLHGKGNKLRRCPLWQKTVNELFILINERKPSQPVFLNRYNKPLTRFGIYSLIKQYAEKVANEIPSLIKKNVTPHSIRHTTATHLLRAGVDINTIRAWLGHVSINTTNIYAEVDGGSNSEKKQVSI